MMGSMKRTIAAVIGTTAVAWVTSIAAVGGQAAPPDRPPMTEEVFKNIQVLKGIPVDQFMGTMGFFSASLGLNCTDCHSDESGGNWEKYADDTPLKRTARRMITMMQAINDDNFGGRQLVTCNTCHRGTNSPNVMPSLTQLYGTPPPEEPGDPIVQAQGQPPADSILDKYIAAVGGAQKAAAFTSFSANVPRLRRFGSDAARDLRELERAARHDRPCAVGPDDHDLRWPHRMDGGTGHGQAVPT